MKFLFIFFFFSYFAYSQILFTKFYALKKFHRARNKIEFAFIGGDSLNPKYFFQTKNKIYAFSKNSDKPELVKGSFFLPSVNFVEKITYPNISSAQNKTEYFVYYSNKKKELGIFSIDNNNYLSLIKSTNFHCSPENIKIEYFSPNAAPLIIVSGNLIDGIHIFSFQKNKLLKKSLFEGNIFSTVAFSKIDKDSLVDIISYNPLEQKLELYFNNGINDFIKYKDILIDIDIDNLFIDDLNANQKLIVAVYKNKIKYFSFVYDYDVKLEKEIILPSKNIYISHFFDFNGDGIKDFIGQDIKNKSLKIFLNIGNSKLIEHPIIENDFAYSNFNFHINDKYFTAFDDRNIFYFAAEKKIELGANFFLSSNISNLASLSSNDSSFVLYFDNHNFTSHKFAKLDSSFSLLSLSIDNETIPFTEFRTTQTHNANELEIKICFFNKQDNLIKILKYDYSSSKLSNVGYFYIKRNILDINLQNENDKFKINLLTVSNDTLFYEEFILNNKTLKNINSIPITKAIITEALFSSHNSKTIYYIAREKIYYVFYQVEVTSLLLSKFRLNIFLALPDNCLIYEIFEHQFVKSTHPFLIVIYKLDNEDHYAYSNGKIQKSYLKLPFKIENMHLIKRNNSPLIKNFLVYDKDIKYFFMLKFAKDNGLTFMKTQKYLQCDNLTFARINKNYLICFTKHNFITLFKIEEL